MGSGAYLAAKSEREIFEAEFAREREAVQDNEAEAREVLSLSYQIRGLPEEDAKRFVDQIAKDKEQLIKALARERLNTTEEGLSKPMVSAVSGALFHCHCGLDSNHSLLLHGGYTSGDRRGNRLANRSFCSRSSEVPHHHPILVEQRS